MLATGSRVRERRADLMGDRYDVIIPGDYYCDLIFTGLPELPRLGTDVYATGFELVPGGAFYPVLALHRLGLKVGWVADLGTDLFSRFVLERAEAEGLDTTLFRLHQRPMRRVASSFSFRNERAIVSYVDNRDETIPVDLVERLCPRVLLIPGLAFWPSLLAVNALPNRSQFLVYQECQHTDLTLATPGLAEALAIVDIFAPNAAEAMQITGTTTLEDALAALAQIAPTTVVKLGPTGAMARRGDDMAQAPVLPVDVADTTGAGDCFNAGFIYGLLRGMSLEDCLRCGNIVGGLSTTAPGAERVPDEAGLARLLKE